MMKMNRNKMMIGLALLTLGVVSCKETDIEFNQEQYDAALKAAFPVQNVDPTHTWTTVGTGKANIRVNGDYGETYTVVLYENHPLLGGDVTEFCRGQVASGDSWFTTFSYPVADSLVYIGIYDKAGRRIIMSAPIEDGIVQATYGAASSNRASRRATEAEATAYAKTLNDYLNPVWEKVNSWDADVTVEQITVDQMKAYTAFTDDDIETYLSSQNYTFSNLSYIESPACYLNHGDGKHYRIASGTEIKKKFYWNGNGNCNGAVLYVEGKLHMDGNNFNGVTVVIADGGEIVLDGNITNSGTSRFVIMSGGKMTGADGKVWDNTNGSYCYNAGIINFKGTLNLNGTHFYNNGTINVDILTGTAGGTAFTNFGSITARTNSYSSSTYNQTWVNGCYVHFTEDAGLGTSVMLRNSRFDIDGDGRYVAGTIEMQQQSELKIGGKMCANGVTFNGPTTAGEYAIVKMNKLVATYGDAITANNQVYFDFNPHEIYGMYSNEDKNYKDDMSDNDYSYSAAGWIVNNKITYWVSESNALNEITIPESCGGAAGFNENGNDGDEIIEGTPLSLRYCFEDNFPSPGDYDFNDVVLTVTPTVSGKVLTVNVSLDAVGASNCLAAAIRVIGAGTAEAAVVEGFAKPRSNFGTYANITTDEDFVTKGSDKVIILFKDAHWAMNNTESGLYSGSPKRIFYNTVKDRNSSKGMVVPKATAQYTLTFATEEQAQTAAAENKFDVFIINPSGFEIHTVQNNFKLSTVLKTLPNMDAYNIAYKDNMPWAIMLPHTSANPFKYPVEWTPIGGNKGYVATGAYQFSNASFAEWATNSESSNDWYKHPEEDLVYDE